MLHFAIPSKGSAYDGTVQLFKNCGLRISRTNPRQYTARLRGLPDTELLLYRPTDIVQKVADGSIDIGITGLDFVREDGDDNDNLLILCEDLGFLYAELVVAVPQTWIDVHSWHDLADLAVEFQHKGRPLRIATKYPNLIRRFCYSQGINVFQLVFSAGSTEAAPGLGYADIIADITETGNTIRDNNLKIIGDTILRSQACLVASRQSLLEHPEHVDIVRQLLDLLEAYQNGKSLYSLIANVQGTSLEAIGRLVTEHPQLAGLQGPTVSPVWNKYTSMQEDSPDTAWYAVNVIVPQAKLLAAVDHLRTIGASTVTVTPVQYAFYTQSEAYGRLLHMLGKEG